MLMHGRRTPAWTWIVSTGLARVALAGCAGPGPEGGRPVREVYEDMDSPRTPPSLVVAPTPEPGGAPRTRPVIYPPKVFAVYVQEHVDPVRDFKIGSHWVYIKLRDSAWTEEAIDREPQCSLPLEKGEDLRPVKRTFSGKGFSEALIPYKGQAGAAPPQRENEEPRAPRREYQEVIRQGEVRR